MTACTKSNLTPRIAAFGAGAIALGLVTVTPTVEAPIAVHLGSVELSAFRPAGAAASPPTSPVKAAATATPIDDVIHAIHSVTWPVGLAVAQLGWFLESALETPFIQLIALNTFLNWHNPLIDGIETLVGGWVTFVRGIYDPISAFFGFARGINYDIPAPCTDCTWTLAWDGTVTILSGAPTNATPAAARSAARPAAASVKNPPTILANAGDQSAPQPHQSPRGTARRAGVEPSSGRSTAARQRAGEQTVGTSRRRTASAQPNSVGNASTESTASATNTAAR